MCVVAFLQRMDYGWTRLTIFAGIFMVAVTMSRWISITVVYRLRV